MYSLPLTDSRTASGVGGLAALRAGGAGDGFSSVLAATAELLWGEGGFAPGLAVWGALPGWEEGGLVAFVGVAEILGVARLVVATAVMFSGALPGTVVEVLALTRSLSATAGARVEAEAGLGFAGERASVSAASLAAAEFSPAGAVVLGDGTTARTRSCPLGGWAAGSPVEFCGGAGGVTGVI